MRKGNEKDDDIQKVKLLYFNLRARGEVLRLLLKHSNLEWEDVLVPFNDWTNGKFDKDSVPSGKTGKKQLPILQVVGSSSFTSSSPSMMPETMDIAKYIAENHCNPSLLGSTAEIASKADRIFLYQNEEPIRLSSMDPLLNFFPVDVAIDKIVSYCESVPKLLSLLTNEIGDGPYVCGSELTYVDFMIFHYVDNLCTLYGSDNILKHMVPSGTTSVSDFYDKMMKLPAISGRLMERPLAGEGKVGRVGSIIYTTKVPSQIDAVKQKVAQMIEKI